MTMQVEVARDRARVAVSVHGELDILSAPELRTLLTELLDGGVSELVIDVAGLEFVDSSGLGVLVGCHRRLLLLGGRLRIVGASDTVARVLEVTGLHRVFDVVVP